MGFLSPLEQEQMMSVMNKVMVPYQDMELTSEVWDQFLPKIQWV